MVKEFDYRGIPLPEDHLPEALLMVKENLLKK
jgi:hypothetical protein